MTFLLLFLAQICNFFFSYFTSTLRDFFIRLETSDRVDCSGKTVSSVHVPREFIFFKTSAGAREREISKCGCLWISSSTLPHSLALSSFPAFFLFSSRSIFAHFGLRTSFFAFLAQSLHD